MLDWTGSQSVAALAGEYGRMLPWDVAVATSVDPADGPARRVTASRRPWEEIAEPGARAELEELVDSPALAIIPVSVPEADLTGALVVLGRPGATLGRQANRVYVKSMLVGDHVDGVLPAWAFFARAVVDAGQLRMTASREGLYDDDLLERVREALGDALRRWMLRTASVNRELFGRFLALHALGVKAVAAVDDDLAAAVLPWLTFETTAGAMTLPEVAARFGVVRWAGTVDEFRQIAPVAAAQGMGVVNAGYTYDVALLDRFAAGRPDARVEPITPGDLDTHVGQPPEAQLAAMWPFLLAARAALDPLDVDVQLRVFQPVTLPALVLDDREARYRRSSRAVAAQQDGDSAWGGILEALDDGGNDRRVLLMNADNPTVAGIGQLRDPLLVPLAMEGLYCQALLAGQHPLQPADTEALNRSFLGLIERTVQ
jgi:molecular chaperone HtpG